MNVTEFKYRYDDSKENALVLCRYSFLFTRHDRNNNGSLSFSGSDLSCFTL